MKAGRSLLCLIAFSIALVNTAFAQNPFTTVSAADWFPIVASNSIAAGFGNGFEMSTTVANQLPLPTTLDNASVLVTDSAGAKATASLFMVSAGQINYLVPANLAVGKATVTATVDSPNNTYTGPIEISNVAPAIFTADSSGSGPPAAQVVRVSGGVASLDPAPFTVGANGAPATAATINLAPYTDSLYLVLYGTGIRNHSANPVIAMIGTTKVPVQYAGAQADIGLDQVNIGPLPQSLANAGAVNLVITVDGIPANTLALNIQ